MARGSEVGGRGSWDGWHALGAGGLGLRGPDGWHADGSWGPVTAGPCPDARLDGEQGPDTRSGGPRRKERRANKRRPPKPHRNSDPPIHSAPVPIQRDRRRAPGPDTESAKERRAPIHKQSGLHTLITESAGRQKERRERTVGPRHTNRWASTDRQKAPDSTHRPPVPGK